MLRRLFLPFCITLVPTWALLAGTPSQSEAQDPVKISPAGPPRILYDWSEQKCGDEFIPDAPARAFRRADGQMTLIATFRTNWSLIGEDVNSLRPSCRPLLNSSDYPSGTGRLWIEATYTQDGQEVVALVSQDLKAHLKAQGCDPGEHRGRCWLNHIVAARSTDMGETFELLPPDERTVATLGDDYPPDGTRRFGVFTTSNIVRWGDGYYMIAFVQGDGLQSPGNCLFRTEKPMNPNLWRAWDGHGFDADMRSADTSQFCATLKHLPNEVRSLSYSLRHKTWIAVFAGRLKTHGDSSEVPGFYYSRSADLLVWERPERIVSAPIKPREDRPDQYWSYPSLIDPNSSTKNFETIENEQAMLIFTVRYLRNGYGTMNRDIQYIPLTIE